MRKRKRRTLLHLRREAERRERGRCRRLRVRKHRQNRKKRRQIRKKPIPILAKNGRAKRRIKIGRTKLSVKSQRRGRKVKRIRPREVKIRTIVRVNKKKIYPKKKMS